MSTTQWNHARSEPAVCAACRQPRQEGATLAAQYFLSLKHSRDAITTMLIDHFDLTAPEAARVLDVAATRGEDPRLRGKLRQLFTHGEILRMTPNRLV